MKLLHISDLHFEARTPSLWPWGPLDWRQLFARAEFIWQGRPPLFAQAAATVEGILIAARAAGVDHVLVSGDLTAISARAEFEAARQALLPFEGRLTVLPGNHDRTSAASARHFEAVFGDWLRSDLPVLGADGGFPLVHLVGDDAAVVALDSARVPRLPGLSQGTVGAAQLAALDRVLGHERLLGRGVVVSVHHAPFKADGSPDRRRHGLTDARELLAIVDRHGVAALCHGHIHHRYEITRPGATPLFDAASSTQRGREGYVLLEVGARGLTAAALIPLGGPASATSREPAAAER